MTSGKSSDKDVSVKLMTVGDGAVGKTSLLMSFAQDKFPSEYVPTVFDNYNCTMLHDNFTVSLGLWDTAGQQDYETLRPLAYPGTHVFLVCFSLVSRPSFSNVPDVWLKEIKKNCPTVPFVLCGTKSDLVGDMKYKDTIVRTEEAEKKAKDWGAVAYLECSGKTQKGLPQVFQTCVEIGLQYQGIIKKDTRLPTAGNPSGDGGGKKGNNSCQIL